METQYNLNEQGIKLFIDDVKRFSDNKSNLEYTILDANNSIVGKTSNIQTLKTRLLKVAENHNKVRLKVTYGKNGTKIIDFLSPQKINELNGIESKIEIIRSEFEQKFLEQKYKDLQEKHEEAKQYIKELESNIDKLKEQIEPLTQQVSLGKNIMEGIKMALPAVMAHPKVIETLNGFMPATTEKPEPELQLSEEEENILFWAKNLKEKNPKNFLKILTIANELAENDELLNETINYVRNYHDIKSEAPSIE